MKHTKRSIITFPKVSIYTGAAMAAVLVAACFATRPGHDWIDKSQGGNAGSGGGMAQEEESFDLSSGVGGSGGSDDCVAPDMLILLDRTLTMHWTPTGQKPSQAPDYPSSKWWQAITALEQVVAPPLDGTIRFGLELWPLDPGGGKCVTLAEQVTGSKSATNAACQAGEVVVPPALDSGAAIAATLDPATTTLCYSTPTGSALVQASDFLASTKESDRSQFVLLVTDGADWFGSCPSPNPLALVQELAAEGVGTYVLSFGDEGDSGLSGVGSPFLNNIACAGKTAADFATNCEADQAGAYTAIDPQNGPPLYLQAADTQEIVGAIQDIAVDICCNCPPK